MSFTGTRPPHWTQGDIDVDGVRLHFHRTGRADAPPLVLLHGLSDSGLCWMRVAQKFESDFDVVMLDARNHGDSATAPATSTLLATDVAAAVSQLGLERPTLVGHSVGAHTAALLASTSPTIISRLVLEDPPWTVDSAATSTGGTPRSRERQLQIRAWLESFQAMTDNDIAELGRTQHADWPAEEFPAWITSNRQVRAEATDGLSGAGWANIVDGISCPTLLLGGDAGRGGIVTESVAAQITASNSEITARFIDGAGHNIRRENFEDYVSAIEEFLHDA